MPDILEVTHDDIKRLKADELHRLLECLLDNELVSNGISRTAASVMLDVTISDGGEDAVVQWEGEPERTTWIPKRRALFQSKSGSSFSAFASEPFVRNSRPQRLKPRVKLNFDQGGVYIYFCGGRVLRPDTRERAIRETRSALSAVYGYEPEVLIYDCNDIKRWTNEYFAAISLVFSITEKAGLEMFNTWTHWAGFGDHTTEFELSEAASAHIARLRRSFEGRGVVERIVGLSGLGKSRIVFEAFRPPENPARQSQQAALSGSMVYVIGAGNERDLVAKIAWMERRHVSGTVVVDDCPHDLHDELARYIAHTDNRLNLLTVDYNVEPEASASRGKVFEVTMSPAATIAAIIRRYHPGLDDYDLEVITKYADGFPKVAALLRDAPLEEDTASGRLTDRILTDRLLWGANQPDEVRSLIIEACSLFAHLGFEGSFRFQRDYVAERICEIKPTIFYRKAQYFKDRRVLDQVGDFVRVSPLPLAIHLSEKFWQEFDPDDTLRLFSDPEMPEALRSSLGTQFANLTGVKSATEIAARLMERNAPFGRADLLNTRNGSHVFRSLATVNPNRAVEAMIREFGDMPIEELRDDVGPGRRWLVWALEALVFHERLFPMAARLLSRFALGENENIGNNATAQYLHLFQPVLGGTEAGPRRRIEEIDRCLVSNDAPLVDLGVRALGRVITSRSSSRISGAEIQGRRVLKDWFPSTYDELFWYFDAAVDRLVPFARQDDKLGAVARKSLGDSFRVLLSYGRIETVERCIREVTSGYKGVWPEALESVRTMIRYGLKGVDLDAPGAKDLVARIESLPSLLWPKDEGEQLRLTVSVPPYGNLEENADGTYTDLNVVEATTLAERYANNTELWDRALPVISAGEQRQAFTFGHRVGELVEESRQADYIQHALYALEGEGKDGNPTALAGLLAALRVRNAVLVRDALDQVASMDAGRFIVYFTACTHPEEYDLRRLTALLESGRLKAVAFRELIGGRVLGAFDPEVVRAFLEPLLAHGLDGVMAALQIGYMYVKSMQEWSACRPLFKEIILRDGLLAWRTTDTMDKYSLQQTIKRLLTEESDESELADHLIRQIVDICRLPDFDINLYDVMQEVMVSLLENYPSVVWPQVKGAFQEQNLYTEYHLVHAMQRSLTMAPGPKSAFLLLSDEELLQWCVEQPLLGPRLVLGAIPLFTYDGEIVHVPELVRKLITDYGSDRYVLSALSGNLESFGNVGSFVPAYEQRLAFVQTFIESPVAEVSAWAAAYAGAYAERIKSQQRRDAEHREGILTPHYADELPEGRRPEILD